MPIGFEDSDDVPAVGWQGSKPLARRLVVEGQGYTKGQLHPQVVGASRQLWAGVLTNALPWIRIHGMPGPGVVPPGLAGPLNDEERQYLQQMLDAGV